MRKAIVTKYLPATNYLGSRVSAGAMDNRQTTFPYPHELNVEQAHAWAAMQFAKKMKWPGFYVAGALGRGNCFVCAATNYPWVHGSALVDYARNVDRPLGKEGEDWFYLDNSSAGTSTAWETEHASAD